MLHELDVSDDAGLLSTEVDTKVLCDILKKCRKLKSVDYSGCGCEKLIWIDAILSARPEEAFVSMSDAELNADSLENFAISLPESPALQHLSLSNNSGLLAVEAAVHAVGDVIQKCHKMTSISLGKTNLSAANLAIFADRLPDDPALECLNLWGNEGI